MNSNSYNSSNINDDDEWGWGGNESSAKPTPTKPIGTLTSLPTSLPISPPTLPIHIPTKPLESSTFTGFEKKIFNIAKFKTFLERHPNKSKALGEYLKSYIHYKLEEANDKPEKVYKQIHLELPFAKIHLPKGPAVIQWNSWFENVDNINNDLYRDVFASFGNKFPRGIKLVSGIVLDKRNTVNRFNMSKTNAVATASFQGTLANCLGTIIKPEDIFGKSDF